MSEVISPAERIEIERACEQLVYAYSRALDLGDTGGAADFFAENGSMARPMAPDQVIEGRETNHGRCRRNIRVVERQHLPPRRRLLKIAAVGNVAVEPRVRGVAAAVDDDVALEPIAQG